MKKNKLMDYPVLGEDIVIDDSPEADDMGLSPEEAAFLRGVEEANDYEEAN